MVRIVLDLHDERHAVLVPARQAHAMALVAIDDGGQLP
jgi:hypothetical protein